MTKINAKIVVLGSMCRTPVPGSVYQVLHYLVGLEKLGFEAFYVEWHGNWVSNPTDPNADPKDRRVLIGEVLRTHGFEDRWICRADGQTPDGKYGALDRADLPGLFDEAAAILNVTGAHHMTPEMMSCDRRAYIETDPGIPQIALFEGNEVTWDLLRGHTHFFTFGEAIPIGRSGLPDTGVSYVPTRQPIVLDFWPTLAHECAEPLTTVARWRKGHPKTVTWRGEVYRWDKADEFLRYVELPASTAGVRFELALAAADPDDVAKLRRYGWFVRDAMATLVTLGAYRRFIQTSKAEFTIAKDQYVRFRTGWFSDRSACYLAAGRPVITEDTGFGAVLPTGEGLFAFSSLEEAVEAVHAVANDYERHSLAARKISEQYFASDAVLADLLNHMEVALP